jgi:FkbM family methyltransferase
MARHSLALSLRRVVRQWRNEAAPLAHRDDNDLIRAVIRRTIGPRSNCIDVGAHRGRFLRAFVRYAPRGQHLAVEPLPHMVADLRERFPGVVIHQAALGETRGVNRFHYVPDAPGRSSLRYRKVFDGMAVECVDVEVTTLDTLAVGRDFALIKIDVEGAQYQVLRGGLALLRRCRPVVVFEHGRMAEADYGTTSRMLFELFASCGMGVQGLEGFLKREPALTCPAFEAAVSTPPRHNFVAFAL